MPAENFLVVIDPTSPTQPALDRAIESTLMTGGDLHLFKCVYVDHCESEGSDEEKKQATLRKFGAQLEALAKKARDAGVSNVSTELVWQETWGNAVVEAAKRQNSFMVFNGSRKHTLAERSRKTSDWTLLRECHCPVMLMHNNTAWGNRKVLAAVNLAAEDTAHQKLNEKVINIANVFRTGFKADVHYINALPTAESNTTVSGDDDDLLLVNVWPEDDDLPAPKHKIEINLDYIAEKCNTDKDHIHLPSGFSAEAILQTAEQLGADLIIVGTVARKGIKGRIIGNTAEKLLDKASCDILTLA